MLERGLKHVKAHPLSLYQKAECLFHLQRYDEAFVILEDLKQLVPRESKVYLLAGKVTIVSTWRLWWASLRSPAKLSSSWPNMSYKFSSMRVIAYVCYVCIHIL